LRNLETEFGESSNAIRQELNKFEDAGLLEAEMQGNKKVFHANERHPLFGDIQNILMKHVGLDQVIDKVVVNLGNVEKVYLTGKFARGLDSQIIDLIMIGTNINKNYLIELIEKVEDLIDRKVRYLIFDNEEYKSYKASYSEVEPLLIWQRD
jgi:DNA-binding transcriptional ArsR family regulator